jgi:hypothetical protein
MKPSIIGFTVSVFLLIASLAHAGYASGGGGNYDDSHLQ